MPDPAASRELIRQWVQTERMISEEKTAWQVEKQRMQQLLEIYRKELKLLDEELSKAGASVESVDENQRVLEQSLKEHREARQQLQATMARLLPRMQALVKKFPQPLADELESDIAVIHDPKAMEKPRDVLKSMIAVLSGAGRFNRTITLAEETRELGEGKKLAVDVIYLGLARAFYVAGTGETAGVGSPSADGWKWDSSPGIADDVRQVIAVYQKTKQPQMVKLPIKLTGEKQGE